MILADCILKLIHNDLNHSIIQGLLKVIG